METDNDIKKALKDQMSDVQDSIVRYKTSVKAKTQVKNDIIGPHERVLNESLKELKMNQEKHFGGDAMQGNRLHKGYTAIKNKDYTLTKCFSSEPEIRHKFNALWDNISAFDTFLAARDPTPMRCEEAAQLCEKWCKMYPVFFPHKNLTRKMAEYSLVLPSFIREKHDLVNKMMRLEQEGEHIHQVMNTLERVYKPIANKPLRYFHMLEAFENKIYCTK